MKPPGTSKWTAYLAPNTNSASTAYVKSANATGENPQESLSTSTSTVNQRKNKWSSYLPNQETCSKNLDPSSNPCSDITRKYGITKRDSISNSNNKWSSYLPTQETHSANTDPYSADDDSTVQEGMSQGAYNDDFGDMNAIEEVSLQPYF